MADITYTPELLTTSIASPEQQITAIYEYVGAVCDLGNSVTYDYTLTETEKAYVVERFGELTNMSQATQYLTKAKQIFFHEYRQDFSPPLNCHDINFGFQEAEGSGLHFYVLGGAHSCLENYGQLLGTNIGSATSQPLELEIIANPQDWIIYLEGLHDGRQQGYAEIFYFAQLAKVLGIPIADPIAKVFSGPEVCDALLAEHKIESIEEFALTQMFSMHQARLGAGMAQTNVDVLAKLVAESRGIPEKAEQLAADYIELYRLEESQQRWTAILERAVAISNNISVENVNHFLNVNPGRYKALFVVGKAHMPVAETALSQRSAE